MTKFIHGRELSQKFFKEIVQPLLKTHFPKLQYSAALIGPGSDVIGFDTPRSMDHDWGPRVLLFLTEEDYRKKKLISDMFRNNLPRTFMGFSTNFSSPNEKGVKTLQYITRGKINHRIEIHTMDSYFKNYLGYDITKKITVQDWLVFSEHKLLTITHGKVFHDDIGLKKVIKKLSYYPLDVWYFLLASQWTRISREDHFMGRCAQAQDELGSRIIGTRLVKDIMTLSFLMERQYSPYIKWFGTGFSTLDSSKKLKPVLSKVLESKNWQEREKYLCDSYEILARMHNSLKITKELPYTVKQFHDRPYLVINGELFADEIKKKIRNPTLKNLKRNIGSINQFSDSTDVLSSNTQKFKCVYVND